MMALCSDDLGKDICEALGLDPKQVRKVVVEAFVQGTEPVWVYVQMVGIEGLLRIDWSALRRGAIVRILSEETVESPHYLP